MGKRRGRSNAAPEVAPLDVDGVRTVAAVTVAWAAAVVVLVFYREQLVDDGRGWWLWTGLAGVGFGLLALEYTRKRRDAYLEEKESEQAPAEQATPEDPAPAVEVGAHPVPSAAAVPAVDPEDYRITGPIAAEPPTVAVEPPAVDPVTAGDGTPGETTGHGGRRRARRGRRASDVDTSPGTRSDESLPTVPVADPGTDPGTNPGVGPGPSRPDTARPSMPTTSSLGSPDRYAEADAAGRQVTGEHAVPASEFETDVRAWLDIAEDEHPVTNYDTMSTRPVPPVRPPTTRPERPARPAEPHSAPQTSDTGELRPSTPRSTPYPGPVQGAPAEERQPSAPAPHDVGTADRGTAPADSGMAGTGSDPASAGGDSATERPQPRGHSVDSEFFDAVAPTTSAASTSGYSDGHDPDAPLLDDTLGGARRASRRADDTAEEELEAGSTGTEGPYRGRRARRPDSR